jgi:hypothetical protein
MMDRITVKGQGRLYRKTEDITGSGCRRSAGTVRGERRHPQDLRRACRTRIPCGQDVDGDDDHSPQLMEFVGRRTKHGLEPKQPALRQFIVTAQETETQPCQ